MAAGRVKPRMFRDSQLIILDEPTSSMDPIAESQLLEKFLDITEGKTAIFVTHRLGSCRHVDKILVLIFLTFALLLSACDLGGEGIDPDFPDESLLAEQFVIWWDEGIPYQLVADTLEKRYPGTKFQFVTFLPPPLNSLLPKDYSFPNLLDMMLSKPSPDLIVFDTRFLPLLIEVEYLAPIPDRYGWETDQDMIADILSLALDLALYALPLGHIPEGLFYNKAVFDEMGVPYPQDGMTWDEVVELAKVFKKDKSSPFGIMTIDSMASQLSLRLYDPETEAWILNRRNGES
jgi:ABC-type glycerol-3-phosphate transport system substrate-binding protein